MIFPELLFKKLMHVSFDFRVWISRDFKPLLMKEIYQCSDSHIKLTSYFT